MKRFEDITAAYWQPKLNDSGEVAEGADDIDQAIRIILATPKGSRPHEPEFGSDINLWLDAPVNVAIPNIIREVVDAVEAWEPRARIVSVTPTLHDSGAGYTLRVVWTLKAADEEITLDAQTTEETTLELT